MPAVTGEGKPATPRWVAPVMGADTLTVLVRTTLELVPSLTATVMMRLAVFGVAESFWYVRVRSTLWYTACEAVPETVSTPVAAL